MAKTSFVPGPKILNLFDQGQWATMELGEWMNISTTGSGNVAHVARRLDVSTGATATSTARVRSHSETGWSIGHPVGVIDWSKKVVTQVIFAAMAGTTNGATRLVIGKTTGAGVGDLATKGIGIKIENLALKGHVHNGTEAADIDLSTTLTASQVYRILIVSDGAGNVEWFVNKARKGATTAGPSVTGSAGESTIQVEADNGGDTADQGILVIDLKTYMGD